MSTEIGLRSLRDETLRKVSEISGENVYKCMQCGTCSAVCPMDESMDMGPRQTMLLLQHGLGDRVLASKTAWLCASCHTCQVRCPRGIEVPRVIEAVRLLTLRENEDVVNPRQIPRETIEEAPQVLMVGGFRKLTA